MQVLGRDIGVVELQQLESNFMSTGVPEEKEYRIVQNEARNLQDASWMRQISVTVRQNICQTQTSLKEKKAGGATHTKQLAKMRVG